MRLYSVKEINFRYDDEFHSWPENDGGETLIAFKNELLAYKKAHELNKKEAQGQEEGLTVFYDVHSFEVNEEDVDNG